jgi:hypothetical protein
MLCPACGQDELIGRDDLAGCEFCPVCCWVFCDGDYGLPFFVPECDNRLASLYERAHRSVSAD